MRTAPLLRQSAFPCHTCTCPLSTKPRRTRQAVCPAKATNDGDAGQQLSDRLKAAEEEAKALREQLAAAWEKKGEEADKAIEDIKRKASRIDGAGLQRETPFAQGPGQWLSEANFLKGMNGPGEAADAIIGNSPEESAVIKRRLLIGGAASVIVVGLSLLPTDALRLSRPSKPQFLYLVPLVRVQNLLSEMEQAAIDGKTEEVETGVRRIQGSPNFAVDNLRNAAAALPNSRAAEKARSVARDAIEYLDSIDYNKYYESLQSPASRSGEQQKLFLDFSLKSIRAAQGKLKAFFALMPAEQLEAAEQQANAPSF